MRFQNLLDAIDLILGWDFPDEVFPDAIKAQASLMAKCDPDNTWELRAE